MEVKHFRNDGKLKLLIIVGTRPEIIRLAAVINECRKYFDTLLAHTGQNYDYNLNGVFFKDLKLADPDVYMEAVGNDLGETMGNIIAKSYQLMVEVKPDAVLVLGDTNSCLSVIGAKRLHIPIFHMEAGNRCKDECLPEETNRRIVDIISDVNMAYSEHARRYLADTGLPKERTYVTGSPMAEVLHNNLKEIESSNVFEKINSQLSTLNCGLSRTGTFCFPLTVKRTLTPRRTSFLCLMPLIRWLRSMICPSSTVVTLVHASVWSSLDSSWISALSSTNLWASTTTTACR